MTLDVKDLSSLEVEFFAYRSASVGQIFLELPRQALSELEEALAQKAGPRLPDNHTVYALTYDGLGGKNVTYLWFTDRMVLFGRTIEQRGY